MVWVVVLLEGTSRTCWSLRPTSTSRGGSWVGPVVPSRNDRLRGAGTIMIGELEQVAVGSGNSKTSCCGGVDNININIKVIGDSCHAGIKNKNCAGML